MATPHKIGTPKIGFAGMGHMGSLMAQRLLRAGYSVTAYNRTPEKLQEVIEHGARTVPVARELARECDLIISCVANDQALATIMYGPDGVLAEAKTGTILIDMSTVSPETSRALHSAASEKGVQMLDAPVSGSTEAAREGQLVIFVGGEHDLYEKCQQIFSYLGRATFYMGSAGAGTIMKLVVNTLVGVGMQAIAEAVCLGQKAGLDRQMLLDVLGETSAVAPAHKGKLANIQQDRYPIQFALPLMRKDLGLIASLAYKHAVPMPVTDAAEQMYTAAQAQGHIEDFSEIARFMEALAGGEHVE